MKVGSTFTGVGGADLGFEWAGYDIAWQCELDAWKRSVLAAHWPSVPIYEDITKLVDPEPVDVLIGGFPCQDLSVAGKRKGFSGERSVLAFEFLRLAESLKPRWLVLENVPGLLSSNKGLDFQRLLSEMVACGYGVGWRCLDARYFGVPQRRRRIFIVARRAETGDDPRGAAGFALRALCEGGGGDSTPCVPAWQETAGGVGVGASVCGFRSSAQFGQWVEDDRSGTLAQRDYKSANQLLSFYPTGGSQNGFWSEDGISPTVKVGSSIGASNGIAIAFSHTQGLHEQASEDAWPTLRVGGGGHAVVHPIDDAREIEKHQNGTGIGDADAPAYTLDRQQRPAVATVSPTLTKYNMDSRSPQSQEQQRIVEAVHSETSVVRRLTPTECERLMAWPDNHTAPEGIKAPDTRRYAACGDGIVANVAYWIATRIKEIEDDTNARP